jgi:hypothetical protein
VIWLRPQQRALIHFTREDNAHSAASAGSTF